MREQKTITLRLGPEDYLQALKLKRKLEAKNWEELLHKLLVLTSYLPSSVVEEIRIKEEPKLTPPEFAKFLEELLKPYESTALEEVLDSQTSRKIAHAREAMKVLLQLVKD